MQPYDHRIERDLGRLHHLAGVLFELVHAEYKPSADVVLSLGDCDAVRDNPHCADPVVRILINAQMLRYATRDFQHANPRYVVGLGLFADELIPTLLLDRPLTASDTARRLHEIRGQIDNLCMGLIVAVDPGMTDFSRD